MKTIKQILLLFLLFLTACGEKRDTSRTPVLEAGGRFLYLDELEAVIPPNASPEDSALVAANFIKKWVTDVLLYEKAQGNISSAEMKEINKTVDEYRKTLILYQYTLNLLQQQLNTNFSESELRDFYNKYSAEFILTEPVIKGLFIKVQKGARNLDNLREWLRAYSKNNTKPLQNIEKYCAQNATSYEYFDDNWLAFAAIAKKMPIAVSKQNEFLTNNRIVEVEDSLAFYFLRIHNFLPAGGTEPFELVKEKIRESLITQKRIEFLQQFEDNLYKNAVKKGDVTFF